MGSRRDVANLISVFDLRIRKALHLSNDVSARVMLIYNKKEGVKRYEILGAELPNGVMVRLLEWLEGNVAVENIAFDLEANNLNADNLLWSSDG